MRTRLIIAMGILLVVVCSRLAGPASPKGSLRFTNADISQVLDVYKALTGANLVIDSRVKKLPYGINLQSSGEDKAEAMKLVERALLEQAGVVITRLEGGKVSVTYNDALPVGPSAEKLSKKRGVSESSQ